MDFDKIARERYREYTKRQARRRRAIVVASVVFGLAWFLLTVAAIILIRVC